MGKEIEAGMDMNKQIVETDLAKVFQEVAAKNKSRSKNPWPADGNVDFLWTQFSQRCTPDWPSISKQFSIRDPEFIINKGTEFTHLYQTISDGFTAKRSLNCRYRCFR